ncbi:MAG: hypothetical protein J6U42_06900, partial [Lachnospiraceae bacterium]|nr:hypothetical protein [Lachnospiraceae bacterium]
MYGRYGLTAGVDGFSRFLLIASFVVLAMSAFSQIKPSKRFLIRFAVFLDSEPFWKMPKNFFVETE